MVQTMPKRQSEIFLGLTSNDSLFATSQISDRSKRSRSPVQSASKNTPTVRKNSLERRKLVKKRSSKDKDQMLKGQSVDTKNDFATCECPSSTHQKSLSPSNKSLKNRLTNKPFMSGKLFDAVLDDDFSLVRECLMYEDMDVNEYSPEGTTVLHLASAAGYLECVELLLECGAKVNLNDANGRMALEYAVLYGNFDCAALLIENGADSKCIKNGIH